jgi:RND family efflux transporter MFP subunit
MLRNKLFWIVLALLVIAGAAYWYWGIRAKAQTTATTQTSQVQTTTVRRGSLIISSTGSGTLIAAKELQVLFSSKGTLQTVNVAVSDKVKAGDVLGTVDDLSARQALASAELSLKKAKTDLVTAQETLQDVLAGPDEAELLQAQANLESAQENLDQLLAGATEAALASARAAIATAQATYDDLADGPSAAELEEAKMSVDRAKNSLYATQLSRDAIGGQLREGQSSSQYDSAQVSVWNAEISVRQAEMAYEALQEPATAQVLQDARAKVLQAQAAYDDLVAGASAAELSSAKAQVATAQKALDELLASPTDTAKLNAEAATEQAQLTLEQAQLAFDLAEQTLAEVTLTAPIDGVITAVNYGAGEKVLADTSLATVASANDLRIQFYVDEADIGMLKVGSEIEATFDALPDQVFKGTVIAVDPALVETFGYSVLRGLAVLDPTSFAKQDLPLGLAVTVDVIGGRAENALLVPVEALRQLDEGEYAVFVMVNGQPRLQQVEVGLQDYTYAEIKSGLEQGDVVTTGIVETR